MRAKSLIVGLLCLFVLMVVFSITTNSQKPLEEADFEVIEIGTGADPQWSPDGKKISFLLYGWMYLANADGEGEIQKLFEIPKTAYRYHWLDSTEFLFRETEQLREEDGRLLEITNRLTGVLLHGTKRTIVESKQDLASPFVFSAPIFMPDGTVGYFQFPPGESWVSDNAVFKVIHQGKLPPDSALKQMRAIVIRSGRTLSGDIWLESLDKSVKKRITTGELHTFVELSPDGTKILSALYVIDLKGNKTRVGEKGVDTADISESSIGTPQAKWSPDSKKIAYMRLTAKILDWDGQAIENIAGEIHIANADGSGIKVIDIPDVIELNPVWSPDGTRIACTGENTGKVYVIKLK
ncbi:MAG: PD40 domain-containing protein [candidate division Zixibacteria bacterium]|nr:PD40 domain-containing protein [candidate division Zixibacteria bacterium]